MNKQTELEEHPLILFDTEKILINIVEKSKEKL